MEKLSKIEKIEKGGKEMGIDIDKELERIRMEGLDRESYGVALKRGEIKGDELVRLAVETSLLAGEMQYRLCERNDRSVLKPWRNYVKNREEFTLGDEESAGYLKFVHEFGGGNLLGLFRGGPRGDEDLKQLYSEEYRDQAWELYYKQYAPRVVSKVAQFLKEEFKGKEIKHFTYYERAREIADRVFGISENRWEQYKMWERIKEESEVI